MTSDEARSAGQQNALRNELILVHKFSICHNTSKPVVAGSSFSVGCHLGLFASAQLKRIETFVNAGSRSTTIIQRRISFMHSLQVQQRSSRSDVHFLTIDAGGVLMHCAHIEVPLLPVDTNVNVSHDPSPDIPEGAGHAKR